MTVDDAVAFVRRRHESVLVPVRAYGMLP